MKKVKFVLKDTMLLVITSNYRLQNSKSFKKGWFKSGDFGWKDKFGNFFFGGRRDSLIIKEEKIYIHQKLKIRFIRSKMLLNLQ